MPTPSGRAPCSVSCNVCNEPAFSRAGQSVDLTPPIPKSARFAVQAVGPVALSRGLDSLFHHVEKYHAPAQKSTKYGENLPPSKAASNSPFSPINPKWASRIAAYRHSITPENLDVAVDGILLRQAYGGQAVHCPGATHVAKGKFRSLMQSTSRARSGFSCWKSRPDPDIPFPFSESFILPHHAG